MSIANQMKNLTDDIISSYKQRAAEFQERLKDNAEINKKVQETLDGFRKDQMEMATTLRASAASLHTNLEQSQKERLKSFKQMMGGIHGSISQIQSEVEEIKISTTVMLSDFSTNHKAAAAELHKELDQNQANLLSWNSSRLKDF